MKQHIINLVKNISTAFIITLVVIGTSVYALSLPTSTPASETSGGVFSSVLKKILLNEDLNDVTNSGTVKYAEDSNMVDGYHADELIGGLGATGTPGKVFIYNLKTGTSCPTGWTQIDVAKRGDDMMMKELNEFGILMGGDHTAWGGGYSPYSTYNYVSNATYGTQSTKFCLYFY